MLRRKKIIKTITNTNNIEELYELLKSCRKTGLKKPYNSCFCIYISGDTTLTAIGGTKDMLIGNSLYETTDELLTKIYELSEFNHTRCLNLNDVNVEDVECVEIKSVPPNIFTPRDVIFYEFEDFFKSVLKRKIVTNKQCILQIIDMLTMGKKYENNSKMPIIDTRFVIDIHLCKNNEIIKIYGNESFFVVGNNIYQTDNLLSDFVWRTGRMCCDTLSCKHFHTERKESLSFEGLHWYDNHARMYDTLLMRFTSPDPLAAQFPSVSPYAYCNNNPVNFIDPDGRRTWRIQEDGSIYDYSDKNKSFDAFVIVDAQGNTKTDSDGNELSIRFDYGTVTGVETFPITAEKDKQRYNMTMFHIKGDDKAQQLFEFVANPHKTTDVEWSHTKIGTEESQKNIVGTASSKEHTFQANYLMDKNYTIRSDVHSHPQGFGPSPADKDTFDRAKRINPNTTMYVYRIKENEKNYKLVK